MRSRWAKRRPKQGTERGGGSEKREERGTRCPLVWASWGGWGRGRIAARRWRAAIGRAWHGLRDVGQETSSFGRTRVSLSRLKLLLQTETVRFRLPCRRSLRLTSFSDDASNEAGSYRCDDISLCSCNASFLGNGPSCFPRFRSHRNIASTIAGWKAFGSGRAHHRRGGALNSDNDQTPMDAQLVPHRLRSSLTLPGCGGSSPLVGRGRHYRDASR